MTKLPVVSGKDLVFALGRLGYEFDHQKGSHIVLRYKERPYNRLTIPNHREISKGTLRSILKRAGILVEELQKVL